MSFLSLSKSSAHFAGCDRETYFNGTSLIKETDFQTNDVYVYMYLCQYTIIGFTLNDIYSQNVPFLTNVVSYLYICCKVHFGRFIAYLLRNLFPIPKFFHIVLSS